MFGRGIAYSSSDNSSTNSMNDTLSVETEDGGMSFKAMASGSAGRTGEHLSFEGAAEYYWTTFLEPLQRRR